MTEAKPPYFSEIEQGFHEHYRGWVRVSRDLWDKPINVRLDAYNSAFPDGGPSPTDAETLQDIKAAASASSISVSTAAKTIAAFLAARGLRYGDPSGEIWAKDIRRAAASEDISAENG